MPKTLPNKKVRVELWFFPSDAKFIEKHLTKPKESRKGACERIVLNAIEKARKVNHKTLFSKN